MSIDGAVYAESVARLWSLENGSKVALDPQILFDLRIITDSYFSLQNTVADTPEPSLVPGKDINFALLTRHWLTKNTFSRIAHLAFSYETVHQIESAWSDLGAALRMPFAQERLRISLAALHADCLYVNHEMLFRREVI
ncbi:hypothetical protein [Burkholderia sp. GS2Y]|uniref:Uncharacterized protein n=1 Tax=Burkholderia theae TaxID=3143496 RepID=A0ABU9WBF3_9BURK